MTDLPGRKMVNAEDEILELESDADDIDVDDELTVVRGQIVPAQTRVAYKIYAILPAIYLAVALLGGLRLGAADNAFLFLRPALACLVFAALLLILYFRSGLIAVNGWLSEEMPALQNAANLLILVTMFAATVQLFNSLLPEQGLPFWVVGFCFFWTIWNNLFAEFAPRRLLQSLIALFGLAFVVKYLVLANLTGTSDAGWLQRLIEDPAKETFTWLLDLPRYSAGTGYIQFFTVALYFIGLLLTPRSTRK